MLLSPWQTNPLLAALLVLLPVLLLVVLTLYLARRRWIKLLISIPLVSLLLSQLLLFGLDASGQAAKRQFAAVRQVLASPAQWHRTSGLSGEQAIIALSFLSEGLANHATRYPDARLQSQQLIEQAVQALLSPEICPFVDATDSTAWATREENLYLSHLNVALGSYARIAAPSPVTERYAGLQRQLSHYLDHRMATAPSGNIPSYGGVYLDTLWTADNAVMLHSLWLYHHRAEPARAAAPGQNWLHRLEAAHALSNGLPYSELRARRPPRGCATSWLTKYMAAFAPDTSARWWQRYTADFKYNLGIACLFREYPPGVDLPEDFDSGPIVLGAGAAATGLALPGAKYQRDYYTYYQLLTTVFLAEQMGRAAQLLGAGSWEATGDTWLAKSILFNAAARR